MLECHLLRQAGLKAGDADSNAVMLIPRFDLAKPPTSAWASLTRNCQRDVGGT